MITYREGTGLESMFNLFLLESKEKDSPWVVLLCHSGNSSFRIFECLGDIRTTGKLVVVDALVLPILRRLKQED